MTQREALDRAIAEANAAGLAELATLLVMQGLLLEVRDELRQLRHLFTEPEVEPPCTHPEEFRKDLSSMGEVEFICGLCKAHVGPHAKEPVHG